MSDEQTIEPRTINPVLFQTIGGSSSDKSTRCLGYNLVRNGWYNSDIDKRLDDHAAQFAKRNIPFRYLLHNPWGHDGEKAMDFDQRIEAGQNPKLDLLVSSFPAWLESRVRPHVGKDGECIIYLGALDIDPDFVALRNNPKAYRERVVKSLRDIPDWCSIAFDHSAEVKAGSIEWSVMLGELAGGRRIYCEARPHKGSATVGLPVICDANFWQRSNPDLYGDSKKWAAPYSDMAGAEVLCLVYQGSDADRAKLHKRTIGWGLTPLLDARDFWVLDEVSK